jgi:hypothetical protein
VDAHREPEDRAHAVGDGPDRHADQPHARRERLAERRGAHVRSATTCTSTAAWSRSMASPRPRSSTGIVRSLLTGATKAGSDYWSEESKIWSATNGYPRCGALHEQRLVLGGTTLFPNAVWGSRTGIYDDFTNGAADDDGFAFFLVAEQQNPVQQLVSSTHLLAARLRRRIQHARRHRETDHADELPGEDRDELRREKRAPDQGRAARCSIVQRAGRKVRALTYDSLSNAGARHHHPLGAHHRGRHRRRCLRAGARQRGRLRARRWRARAPHHRPRSGGHRLGAAGHRRRWSSRSAASPTATRTSSGLSCSARSTASRAGSSRRWR